MSRKRMLILGIVVLVGAALATVAFAGGKSDLAQLRSATSQFHSTENAQAAGYNLLPDLDHCFDNPGVGAMGFHYINTEFLEDINVDPLHPEAMVYAPGPNGQLKLAAVEFIVPAEAWDAVHNELPSAYGQSFHLNESLGVYVLHAWIWKNNPSGMFKDWNPKVSCP